MKNNLNLVIADENDVFLDGMEKLLSQSANIGKVYRALNGLQALELLENNKVDILITEIKMHEMSGMKIIQAAKNRYPGMMIIILTAGV